MEYLNYNNYREEIINGEIYARSPSSIPHVRIITKAVYLFTSLIKNKACEVFGDGILVILDSDNKFMPDMTIICDKSKFSDIGYEGSPTLVVEVLSQSTKKRDLTVKKDAYEKFGVKEYLIVDQYGKSIDQYILKDKKYELHESYIYTTILTEEEEKNYNDTFVCHTFPEVEIKLEDIFMF